MIARLQTANNHYDEYHRHHYHQEKIIRKTKRT